MAKKNKDNKTNGELNAQSLNFLGLSKQPFANEILTEKSFFNTQSLTKISDSLIHQIQFSDLLLLVEGEHGSGKTSLFRKFIQTEIANTKSLSMQAEATDTLMQIQQKMSIHLQDLGDANHLDENLKNLQMFDQTPLIIMDNSHVLSDTTLQELFRYQHQLKQEHDVTLKILLLANSGMSDTLQKITDIQADQIYVQVMPKLSPKQVDNFITHRLRSAGYTDEPLLTNNDIQQLLKKTNGTPLEIMNQAAQLIDKIIQHRLNPPTPTWIKTLSIIFILLIIIAGAYFYFLFDKTESEPSEQMPLTTSSIEETSINDVTDVINVLESDQTTADTVEVESENEAVDTIPVAETITEPAATELKEPENITSINTKTQSIEKVIADVAPPPQVSKPAELKSTPDIQQKTEQKAAQVEVKTKANIKAAVNPAVPVNPVLLELEKMGLRDANWLNSQNSQNWTLQLLGARDPETLLKFAQRNQLSTNAAWYKTWLTSKPYYVMVYGSYNSRENARNAIAGLPPQLRSLKPWVKSMKSVQNALK
ncbi:MAG: SPOR domain-containing protein [Gammaproteobacteria bacterium]|nr:SPOR domain-containing protein [Gammaproteobacteria bacterium]